MGSGGPRRGEQVIRETIVTTLGATGKPHVAAMGVREKDGLLVIAPFRPSRTLDNLRRKGTAVINHTDDVRIWAGCLTGRRDWPTVPVGAIEGVRLVDALTHVEVEVDHCEDDALRPRFYCRERSRAEPRRVPGVQPRAGRGDRGIHPGKSPAPAAGGKSRARDGVSPHCGGEDRGPARAGSLAVAGGSNRRLSAQGRRAALSPRGETSPGTRPRGPARRGPG